MTASVIESIYGYSIETPPVNNKRVIDPEEQKITKKAKKLMEKHRKRQSKLKSLPCNHWANFNCTNGDNCPFSHQGPGGDPRSKILCRFIKSGSCVNACCPYSHDTFKFPCAFYHFKSKCTAVNCRFSHDPITDEQKAQFDKENVQFHQRKKK
jgi:hypothetical protein